MSDRVWMVEISQQDVDSSDAYRQAGKCSLHAWVMGPHGQRIGPDSITQGPLRCKAFYENLPDIANDDKYLWVVQSRAGAGIELQTLDVNGRSKLLLVPASAGSKEIITSSAAGGTWLMTEEGVYSVSMEVEATSSSLRLHGPVLAGSSFSLAVRSRDHRSLWLISNQGHLYQLSDRAQVLRDDAIGQLVSKRQVALATELESAWVGASGGLRLVPGGTSKAPAKIFRSGIPVTAVSPVAQGEMAVFVNNDLENYLAIGDSESSFPVFNLPVDLDFVSDGLNTWAQNGNNIFTFGSANDVGASLSVNGKRFDHRSTQRPVVDAALTRTTAVIGSITAELKWPSGVRPDSSGRMQLSLYAKEDDAQPVSKPVLSWDLPPGDSATVNIDQGLREWNKPHRLILTYRDRLGTDIEWVWPEVEFTLPFWAQPWVRALLLAIVLLVVMLILMVFRDTPRFGRFLPLGWSAGTGLGSLGLHSLLLSQFQVDGQFLAFFLLIGLCGLCLLGFVSAPVFRLLVEVEPFNRFAGVILARRHMRRVLYSQLAASTQKWVEDQCRYTFGESYCPLPASIVDSDGNALVEKLPARYIVKRLLTAINSNKDRPSVLVQSPGGRGKSALVRRVVKRLLVLWSKDPLMPLPLIVPRQLMPPDAQTPSDQKLHLLLAEVLRGEGLFESSLLEQQIQDGHFLLIIDGITESPIDATVFAELNKEARTAGVCFIASARPSAPYREAAQAANTWMTVEPLALTEKTLERFVKVYAGRPSHKEIRTEYLTKLLAKSWRSADDTFLPIIIRLAIEHRVFETNDVTLLYRKAFENLLRKRDGAFEHANNKRLLDAAMFCYRTYWQTGNRHIDVETETNQDVRELLKELLAANILAPTDGEGHSARFFHDSMQSFLTAWALRHAKPPAFLSESVARANLRRDGEPEIFRMCRHVLGVDFESMLCEEVERWIQHHARFTTEHVLASLSEGLRADFAASLNEKVERKLKVEQEQLARRKRHAARREDATPSSGTILRMAFDRCKAKDGGRIGPETLGFFERMAPYAWRREAAQAVAVPPDAIPMMGNRST
jgi:hypothetical protein